MNKNDIINRSRTLFMQNGIKKMTMDMIVKELGISKRTLYLHFINKEYLVRACIDFNRSEHISLLHCNSSSNIIEIFFGIYRYIKYLKGVINPACAKEIKNRYKNEFNYALSIVENQIESISSLINKDKSEKIIREEIDGGYIVSFLRFYIYSIWETNDPNTTECAIIFLRGICSQKGSTMLDRQMGSMMYKQIV